MDDYRVQLDVYNGPLDLLLYLIRKDELDVYDIPIASITDQYVEHIEMLQHLDPNLAGEFLVLATTLMEIKSRMLLPRDVDADDELDEFDPRTELVRQLLEYKRFKDAAAWLAEAADEQSLKFPRVPVLGGIGGDELELEDLQIWDLVDAFGRLLQATLAGPGVHEVEDDDTPQALYQADLLDRLQRDGPMPLVRVFEGRSRRAELIGLFLALLELIRQGLVQADQDEPFGDIYISLKVDLPDDERGKTGDTPASRARPNNDAPADPAQ